MGALRRLSLVPTGKGRGLRVPGVLLAPPAGIYLNATFRTSPSLAGRSHIEDPYPTFANYYPPPVLALIPLALIPFHLLKLPLVSLFPH